MPVYDPTLTVEWADGTHQFRLGVKQIEELEEACGDAPDKPLGIYAIARRFASGDARLAYVRHVLRLGLIGAKMDPIKALRYVQRYIDPTEHPEGTINQAASIAVELLGVTLEPPLAVKKNSEPTETKREPTPTADSTLEKSTA